MGIVQFIEDRLAEDERDAKLAAEAGRRADPRHKWVVEEWHSDDPAAVPAAAYVNDEYEIGVAVVNGSYAADHIARHDPARVLAEVAAKRAIVAWHEVRRVARDARDPEMQATVDICWYGYDQPCATIRHLAAVYADHPDYDPVWRPE